MIDNPSPSPEFNSGIAYLETIDLLQKAIHRQNNSKDYDGMYQTLLSLQIEIMGRVKSKKLTKIIDLLKPLEKNCTILIMNKGRVKEMILFYNLLKWWEALTIIRHDLGLVMPDKGGGWEAIGEV